MPKTDKQAQLLALALPALLLGGAYVSEYGFGLIPCEMCWWQRWPHFAALALAGASFVLPPQRLQLRRLLIMLAAVAMLVSGLIGVFHAGVEYGWWEGITACSVPTAAAGGDALEAIFAQPLIRCDQAQWDLLGISLAGFNALFSIGGAVAVFALLQKKSQA